MNEAIRSLYLILIAQHLPYWLLGIGGDAMLFGAILLLVGCDICLVALSQRDRSRTGETKPNETESTYGKCDSGNRK